MSAHLIVEAILLSLVVLACGVGTLGMLRMSQPVQALHFLGFPAMFGSILLTMAIFVEVGSKQQAWKMLLIAAILTASNSIVSHATARAFRERELGHWNIRDGDAELISVDLNASSGDPR